MEKLSKLIGATIDKDDLSELEIEHGYMTLKAWKVAIKLEGAHGGVHQQVLDMVNAATAMSTVRTVYMSIELTVLTCYKILKTLASRTQLTRIVLKLRDPWIVSNVASDSSLFMLLADVLNSNQMLRSLELELGILVPAHHQCKEFVDAVVKHPKLKYITLRETFLSPETILEIMRRNRIIQWYSLAPDHVNTALRPSAWPAPDLVKLENIVRNNWAIITIDFRLMRPSRLNDMCWERGRGEVARVVQHYVRGLQSLGLSTYETLWILDWLPPMDCRYRWDGDPAFDPHHGKKVALIEGMTRSYRRIVDGRH